LTKTENKSWIKIYRSLLDWEWYQDTVTRDLFIHCLLKANYKKTTWKGIKIGEGEFITSIENLAKEISFSVRNIRTAIKHLKSTNEITTKPTNKYTLIKIENWGLYQMSESPSDKQDDKQDDKQVTIKRQASDKQVTTVKEVKKEKKERSKEVKHKYGEFSNILLTDNEYSKLQAEYTNTKDIIKFFDSYIEEKGYKAKSHYLSIKRWVANAVKERGNKTVKETKSLTLQKEIEDELEKTHKYMKTEGVIL
jgi:hypothetical protein